MQTLKKTLGYVLKFLDMLLMAISPLMVIMFIIAVIMGINSAAGHLRLVRALEQKGQVTTGSIDYVSIHLDSITVNLVTTDGSQIKGYLALKYYSEEVIHSLNVGDEVAIRYVPGLNDYPIDLVLENHYDQVRGHWVTLVMQAAIMALVSWVFIVIHPEVLFYGFGKQYTQGLQETLTR
ncbi:MAG: hypothetical protein JW726_16310 [Anaerolineales bacterium]|nr:hypothetical protein [Anaerolineales bacterium]